jgi:hypothetical protein
VFRTRRSGMVVVVVVVVVMMMMMMIYSKTFVRCGFLYRLLVL